MGSVTTPETSLPTEFEGTRPVEVAPGSADDPFTARPAEASGDASAHTVGEPNAAPGAPQEPAQSPPVEGAPPAETAPPEEEEPAATTAPPAQPPPPAEEDEAALTRLDEYVEGVRAEERQAAVESASRAQSTTDRRMNDLTGRIDTLGQERTQMTEKIRELEVKGLPEDQRQELERRWSWEDRRSELNGQEELLNQQHDDLEIMRLLMDYRDYFEEGAEEELRAIPFEDREAYCLAKANANLTNQLEQVRQGNGTGSQTAPPAPEEKPPAGLNAPSDVGGSPPPPPAAPQFNTGQGPEAMRENVGTGWEPMPASSYVPGRG